MCRPTQRSERIVFPMHGAESNPLEPALLVVVLTGFARITAAVEAILLPLRCEAVKPREHRSRFRPRRRQRRGRADEPLELDQDARVGAHPRDLAEIGFSIFDTARRLAMHRRTQARKLGRQQVK